MRSQGPACRHASQICHSTDAIADLPRAQSKVTTAADEMQKRCTDTAHHKQVCPTQASANGPEDDQSKRGRYAQRDEPPVAIVDEGSCQQRNAGPNHKGHHGRQAGLHAGDTSSLAASCRAMLACSEYTCCHTCCPLQTAGRAVTSQLPDSRTRPIQPCFSLHPGCQ